MVHGNKSCTPLPSQLEAFQSGDLAETLGLWSCRWHLFAYPGFVALRSILRILSLRASRSPAHQRWHGMRGKTCVCIYIYIYIYMYVYIYVYIHIRYYYRCHTYNILIQTYINNSIKFIIILITNKRRLGAALRSPGAVSLPSIAQRGTSWGRKPRNRFSSPFPATRISILGDAFPPANRDSSLGGSPLHDGIAPICFTKVIWLRILG